jgi:hypothetical protein
MELFNDSFVLSMLMKRVLRALGYTTCETHTTTRGLVVLAEAPVEPMCSGETVQCIRFRQQRQLRG